MLIVEDNSINRIVLRDLLEQDGHKADEAHDGQEGVERVKKNSYDLVIMDISMPIMDGVEATRAIRQCEARGTRLPMVALTAHARREDEERFRAVGLDDIFVKPITRTGLRDIIARLCGPTKGSAPPKGQSRHQGATLNESHLAQLIAAMGPTKITALVTSFLSETDLAVAEIATSLEHRTGGAGLRQLVHHTAGSCALMGATTLRDTLVAFEDRIEAGALPDHDAAAALRRIWQATSEALQRHTQRP